MRHAHVYLLRGLVNVFSLGMDQLAAKIAQRGIYTSVHNHLAWQNLAAEAVTEYRAGRMGPIIIIGHSLGADAAVAMAVSLAKSGIPVRLVVTFDPVTTMIAEGNIARVVNLYISNGWGSPVARGPNFRGTIVNVDVKNRPEVGHVFIDKSAALHQQVIGYVMQAVTQGSPSSRPPAASADRQANDHGGSRSSLQAQAPPPSQANAQVRQSPQLGAK